MITLASISDWDENVGRRDITMDNLFVMQVLHSQC